MPKHNYDNAVCHNENKACVLVMRLDIVHFILKSVYF